MKEQICRRRDSKITEYVGLKQAANCFYRLLVSVMRLLSFDKRFSDTGLYHRRDVQSRFGKELDEKHMKAAK